MSLGKVTNWCTVNSGSKQLVIAQVLISVTDCILQYETSSLSPYELVLVCYIPWSGGWESSAAVATFHNRETYWTKQLYQFTVGMMKTWFVGWKIRHPPTHHDMVSIKSF